MDSWLGGFGKINVVYCTVLEYHRILHSGTGTSVAYLEGLSNW